MHSMIHSRFAAGEVASKAVHTSIVTLSGDGGGPGGGRWGRQQGGRRGWWGGQQGGQGGHSMEIAPKTVHTLIPVDSLDQDSMHSLMQSLNKGCINERQNQLKGSLHCSQQGGWGQLGGLGSKAPVYQLRCCGIVYWFADIVIKSKLSPPSSPSSSQFIDLLYSDWIEKVQSHPEIATTCDEGQLHLTFTFTQHHNVAQNQSSVNRQGCSREVL